MKQKNNNLENKPEHYKNKQILTVFQAKDKQIFLLFAINIST